jgi:hypothetical protein
MDELRLIDQEKFFADLKTDVVEISDSMLPMMIEKTNKV